MAVSSDRPQGSVLTLVPLIIVFKIWIENTEGLLFKFAAATVQNQCFVQQRLDLRFQAFKARRLDGSQEDDI